MAELTEKQRRFVEAYTGPAMGNATEAARMAGYADPDANAHRLISHDGIRREIEKARAPTTHRAILTREERQEILSELGRGAEKESDRIRAVEVLGKMQGDFIERHEVAVSGQVQVYLPDNGRKR